jgi:hypothetical protein
MRLERSASRPASVQGLPVRALSHGAWGDMPHGHSKQGSNQTRTEFEGRRRNHVGTSSMLQHAVHSCGVGSVPVTRKTGTGISHRSRGARASDATSGCTLNAMQLERRADTFHYPQHVADATEAGQLKRDRCSGDGRAPMPFVASTFWAGQSRIA